MMATTQERLVQWLRDAHAMEQQAEKMLGDQSQRIEHYPDLKARMQQHLEETREQARQIESCIKRHGGDTSAVKDFAGRFTALAQGMSGYFVGDEVVKASLAAYTFEHMEISSYRSLIATAEAAGDHETKQICENILRQEEAMAKWLEEHIGPITKQYLQREETPNATSKH
jgi:ferritin-like metal-binding protein YciE